MSSGAAAPRNTAACPAIRGAVSSSPAAPAAQEGAPPAVGEAVPGCKATSSNKSLRLAGREAPKTNKPLAQGDSAGRRTVNQCITNAWGAWLSCWGWTTRLLLVSVWDGDTWERGQQWEDDAWCLMGTQVSTSCSAMKCLEGQNLPHPDITQRARETPPRHVTK